jgi:acyl-[acyl-carrier-protein]-phospholipid O-acyltransferase/long-chain-fatty-acid--[acyl-carrier-protein] ligase
VRVDSRRFVYILGRLKRFAKVSGEMVSLAAVEEALSGAFDRYGSKTAVAIVARPDAAKGEKLIAVTNEPKITLTDIRELVHARGLGNLAVPKEIRLVKQIPLLGTGKVDLRALDKLVQ